MRKIRNWVAHFWSRVDRESSPVGCWLWTGPPTKDGYGKFSYKKDDHYTTVNAHRFAYQVIFGEIGDSFIFVCHNCPSGDNPLCVNPKHLWLGTNQENLLDASRKGTIARGERNGSILHPERLVRGEQNYQAKLNPDLVKLIRRESGVGKTQVEIAKIVNVSRCTVASVIKGETWVHVQ